MTKSEIINQALGRMYAYVSWGRHVTPSGTKYGYAGYTHAGMCDFLGRDFEAIVKSARVLRCPLCADEVTDPQSGCTKCEVFRCEECKRWVGWGQGCADDKPEVCDDCYGHNTDEEEE